MEVVGEVPGLGCVCVGLVCARQSATGPLPSPQLALVCLASLSPVAPGLSSRQGPRTVLTEYWALEADCDWQHTVRSVQLISHL